MSKAAHGVGPRTATPDGVSSREGLRDRKKRDKRDRLRSAAWELFSTKGFDGTTTRAIAARAGVATGTVFLYAKDKTDLLFLVFEHRLRERVESALRTIAPEAHFIDQLMHVFGHLLTMYAEAPDVGRRFVKEFPGAAGPNADRVHAITFRFLADVARLVERAQQRGELRADLEPMRVAETVFGIYFVSLMGWLMGMISMEYARDGQLRPGLELLLRGIAAR